MCACSWHYCRYPMLLESPIHCLSPSSTMGPPRRARRSCWKLWKRTLTSVQELSWGMMWCLDPANEHAAKIFHYTHPTPSSHFYKLLNYPFVCLRELDMKKPIYQRTAVYGHFGRDVFPWEVPKQLKYWTLSPLIFFSCTTDKHVCLSTSPLHPPSPSSSSSHTHRHSHISLYFMNRCPFPTC